MKGIAIVFEEVAGGVRRIVRGGVRGSRVPPVVATSTASNGLPEGRAASVTGFNS